MQTFLESFSQEQFQKISDFFETMPQTAYNANIVCRKCGWKTDMTLKGISDFFV